MADMRTRVFHTWFRLSRSVTLGARAIVENDNGEVLLVRHTYTKGLYLPGGGVERGEPALEAIRRELIEEAGVEVLSDPELIGVYSNHRHFRNDHVLLYRVRPHVWRPCTATSRGEISERIWTSPDTPPDDITPGNARRLREVYFGESIDPYW